MEALLIALIVVAVIVGLVVWGLNQAPSTVPPILRWAAVMVVVLIAVIFLLRFLPAAYR